MSLKPKRIVIFMSNLKPFQLIFIIGLPYAVNLIHSPFDATLEKGNVELFLRRGVRVVEASAFMNLTEHVVRYRVAGLKRDSKTGCVIAQNKVIFKLSRTELAEMAMRPPPQKLIRKLLQQGVSLYHRNLF